MEHLCFSVIKESFEVVCLLRNTGADVSVKTVDGRTACTCEDVDVMRCLIDAGVCVNCLSNEGWTPLHHATSEQQFAIMDELIAANADVNAQFKSLRSPLHNAPDKSDEEALLN